MVQTENIDFETFLRERKILLLGFPKVKLDPGEIYETQLDDSLILNNIGDLTDIVTLKNSSHSINSLELPQLIEQPLDFDLHGIITFGSRNEVKVSILEKLLKVVKLDTLFKREDTEKAELKMDSVKYTEIKTAKLENALQNFVFRDRYISNLKYYYVVTKVYFCEGFNMTLFDTDSTQLDILAKAKAIADGTLKILYKDSKKISLRSTQKIAFAVGLSRVDYSPINREITLAHITFSDKPHILGIRDIPQKLLPRVYLINSDQ